MSKRYPDQSGLHGQVWLGWMAMGVALAVPATTWAQAATKTSAASEQSAAQATDGDPLTEVVVTGSRIARSGFKTPTPVAILQAERLEQLGVTNIGEGLNMNPAFRAGTTPVTSGLTFGTIGSRLADLRGLGATRTLVLLNGRRVVASTSQATVDLNLMPSIIMSRTEVVTGGASAAYGSDAVAGVVNILMDNKLTGLKVNTNYGVSTYGDANDNTLALAWGTPFAGNRGHFVIASEYELNGAVGDCYTRPWCSEERQALTTPKVRPADVPGNLLAYNVHTSTQTPGGIITSGPFAGTQFAADGTPYAFTYGQYAGNLFQIGGSGKGQNAYISDVYIQVPVERYTAYSHATFDFSDSVTGFLEANYADVVGRALGGDRRDAGSLTISTSNPFIPASLQTAITAYNVAHPTATVTSFKFGRQSVDMGPGYATDRTQTYRIVGGLSGKFGSSGWTWDASYQFGHSNFLETVANNPIEKNWALAVDAVLGPNGLPTCRSTLTAPTNGCSPLNLFGEGKLSDAAVQFATSTAMQTRSLDSNVATLNIQGEPFSTWAGPVAVATGGEFRSDKVVGTTDAFSQALAYGRGNGSALNGEIKVSEGYLEAEVPLAKNLAFAKSIELNGAARRTHYSTAGDVTTWKAGLVWEPSDWLRLRGTKSRDIRAPNLYENFSTVTANSSTINDTATNSQSVVPTRSGGNPGLTPEKADTLTAGFVLSPQGFLNRLNVSVDYYRIEVADAIGSLAPQAVVTQCNIGNTVFCPLVQRDGTNQITLVSSPYLNLNTLQTEGVDVVTQYALPLNAVHDSLPGTLNFNVNATYIAHLTTVQKTGSLDIAGVTGCSVTSFFSCVPHWTFDGSVNYEMSRFSVTARGHYIPRSVYDPTFVGPEDPGYNPTLANSINTNRVSGRLYMYLSGQYDILKDKQKLVQVYGAVNNLLNVDPPLMPGRANNTFFDPIGRYFKLGVRAKF